MLKKLPLSFQLFILSLIFLAISFSQCSPVPESEAESEAPVVNKETPIIDSIMHQRQLYAMSLINTTRYRELVDTLLELTTHENFKYASDSSLIKMYCLAGYTQSILGEYEGSLKHACNCIDLRWKGERVDSLRMAYSYFSRSNTYQALQQYDNAIDDIKRGIDLLKTLPNQKSILMFFYSILSNLYAGIDDYSKAKEYYSYIIEDSLQGPELAIYYENKAISYNLDLKQFDQALKNLESAISIYHNLGVDISEYNARFNVLAVLDQKEDTDFQEQIVNYQNFLQEYTQLEHPNTQLITNIYSNLASSYFKTEDYENTIAIYKKAIQNQLTATGTENDILIARAFTSTAKSHFRMGQIDSSLHYYQKAYESICLDFKSDDPYQLPDFEKTVTLNNVEFAKIILFKADDLYAMFQESGNQEHLQEALKIYTYYDEFINFNRKKLAKTSQFISLVKNKELYEKLIHIYLRELETEDESTRMSNAYFYGSKYKAILLLEGIDLESSKYSKIPQNKINEELALMDQIKKLDQKIQAQGVSISEAKDSLIYWYDQRIDLADKFDRMIENFEVNYPEYYELKYKPINSTGLEEIQSKLPDSTIFVEYFIGKDSIYIFNFSNDTEVYCLVKEKPQDFDAMCTDFRKSTEQDTSITVAQYSKNAYNLYQLLLADPIRQLSANNEINRLYIVPDENLLQISFDAFMTDSIDSAQDVKWTQSIPFLLQDYAISIGYSNQLIFNDGKYQDRIPNETYVGFGLEYKDAKNLKMLTEEEVIDTSITRKMGQLLFSIKEVKDCAEMFDGKTFIESEATIDNFKIYAPESSILHLAAHGFIAKDEPLNSGLILHKGLDQEENILRALDIYNMDLSAESVILSACHTGDGILSRGEGIRSLARAFYYAGCRNVTASLWAAPDFSTKEIIVDYFKNIKAGMPKDIALQKAKLKYIDHSEFDKDALPCNWAHLISSGNQEAMEIRRSWFFW